MTCSLMEQLNEQTHAMYAYHEVFSFSSYIIYHIIFFPGFIEENLYLQIVVNSLIIRLIKPDLPKSFYRNVHICTDFLSV